MNTKEIKKWLLSAKSIYPVLVPLLAPVCAAACGLSSGSFTNLPAFPNSGFQVNGLNATGQLAGFFYVAFQHPEHAFFYDSGTLTDLGTFGGNTSSGNAINSSGQIAGQSDLANGQTHAFLYTGGQPQDLGTLGGTSSSGSLINDAGVVVGTSTLSGSTATAGFIYTGGMMINLGTFGGDCTPYGLNNAGVVVGESALTNGDFHAFMYAGGTLKDLGTLGGTYSAAYAVNDAGTVVGQSYVASGDTHAFIYSGGSSLTDLGTFGGSYSSAFALNRTGQVIGVAYTLNDQEMHGFVSTGGPLTDLGTLGGNYTLPLAINNAGLIVGQAGASDGSDHAFIYKNSLMVDLNTLLPTNSGWVLQEALFINDSGRIVGIGTYNQLSQWFIMDLGLGNSAPVAVAGPDQTVDCAGQVTLDGSQSSDPDNDALAFEWSLSGSVLSTNAILVTGLPLGTNVITLTVTDPCGASAQTNVTVRVADTTPPSILSAPSSPTVSAGANCLGTVPDVTAGVAVADNCTPSNQLAVSQSPAAGTLLAAGQYSITVMVTDLAGNSSTALVPLNIADMTPPTIVSNPAPIILAADANCQGAVPNVLPGVVANDNCSAANQLAMSQSPAAGTVLPSGQYVITVTVTDAAGNKSTAGVPLTITDQTPPTIVTTPAPITLAADANCQGAVPNVLPGVVANDNCTAANQLAMSQSPAAGTVLGTGQYVITVTVTDAAGNKSTAGVPLAIVDMTPPSIVSTPAPITVSAADNCQGAVPNVLPGVVATDNCTPANLLVLSQSPAAGTLLGTGQYVITVTVTDAAGNSSTAGVPLTVADTTPPVIQSVTASPSVLSPPNNKPADITVAVTASDNCDTAPVNKIVSITCNGPTAPGDIQLTGDLTATLVASKGPSGSTRVYTISVSSTDAAGNSSLGTTTVTVPGK